MDAINERKARLNELRGDIDELDREIARLIAERMDVCSRIGEQKRALGLPIEDADREGKVLSALCSAYPECSGALKRIFPEIMAQSKRVQYLSRNVYLIGMPNSGKTKHAVKLAAALGRKQMDTDAVVMSRAGKSIDRIFDEDGEAAFRALEHEVLVDAARVGGLVVATGGGILTNEKNIPILKNSGITVFLDRSIDRLALANDKNRPLIREGAAAVIRLYRERIDTYRAAADLSIDPDLSSASARIADFVSARMSCPL